MPLVKKYRSAASAIDCAACALRSQMKQPRWALTALLAQIVRKQCPSYADAKSATALPAQSIAPAEWTSRDNDDIQAGEGEQVEW